MTTGLPRMQTHGGHASYMEPINNEGAVEQRFDDHGHIIDGFGTVKGGHGRRPLL